MQAIFPIAGALLVLLEVVPVLSERTKKFLPLGGTHATQMGAVFGLAFVVYEFATALSQ